MLDDAVLSHLCIQRVKARLPWRTVECISVPFAVSRFARERNLIDLNPAYQREGGVWSLTKQQLFVDSLVNGFDVPKIYMHELDQEASGYNYAVVDGKQRIGTILRFLEDGLAFADDFKFSGKACDPAPGPGDTYKDLGADARDLVRECQLDVVLVRTKDIEEIEELFSRLNNGEKLNAAETRNAFGGRVTSLIRELAEDSFFRRKLGFKNNRYAHYEVACKLLYLEHEASKSKVLAPVDLKKKFLDDFVKTHRAMSDKDADRLLRRVKENLSKMSTVFGDADMELSKQSYPQLMYLFYTHLDRVYASQGLNAKIRSFLVEFRKARIDNRARDDEHQDAELTNFGLLSQQGTNDAGSMKQRIEILTRRFLTSHSDVLIKDPKRAFTMEERWVLWQRSDKKCEQCGIDLPQLEDLDGDHIVWHAHGGPTTLANARALCIKCNRSVSNAVTTT